MEVEVIKANKNNSLKNRIERLRVAAYCRVSTDDLEQKKSYDSMVKHYKELITENKEWIFVDVYADEAVTGTKAAIRDDFMRLINDCLDGKIDLVIAKSISRFARNTLDTLKYVRMLKERNIAIYFEHEKINTLKDGEFLLTILSSVAQQEVENTSANVKKGLKMKMKRGELVGFQRCLGYDYDCKTKELSINEDGAEIVRYIFNRYVAGIGSSIIARELNDMGETTIKGGKWVSGNVLGIIKNEKYKGDVLLGKTFTVDPISKRRLDNLGEEDRFYIKNHHEPIVSEEIFDKAQEILNKRGSTREGVVSGKREKYSRQYAFSSMLKCGYCGAHYYRRSWHSNSEYRKIIWQCITNTKQGKQYCPDSKGIPEQVIEEAFVESYRIVCSNNKDVLEEFIQRAETVLSADSIEDKLKKVQRQIDDIKRKRKKLVDGYLEGTISKELYDEYEIDLQKKLSNENARIDMLCQQLDEEKSLGRRLKDFKKALSEDKILEEFDRGIFESMIDSVIVGGYDENGNKDPYKLTFIYKTGFTHEIDDAKNKYVKKSKKGGKGKIMYSNAMAKVADVCTINVDDACGDGLSAVKKRKINN